MAMKLTCFQGCEINCMVQASNHAECQAVCETTAYCDAWTFRTDIKKCYLKHRTGWSAMTREHFESGFKNQGPWYDPNTDFSGGDYCCD